MYILLKLDYAKFGVSKWGGGGWLVPPPLVQEGLTYLLTYKIGLADGGKGKVASPN